MRLGTPVVVWLMVAYGNMDEVDDFVDQLEALDASGEFRYAICDNSPVPVPSRHRHRGDVATVLRPDNPGYLEGAISAECAAAAAGLCDDADWFVVTNTDLDFVSGDPSASLARHPRAEPLVLAPRVTEGELCIEKNPHVLEPRSPARIRLNRLATLTPLTTMGYQTAAWARSHWGAGRASLRRSADEWTARHAPGTAFYAPYGAIMMFSRGFRDAGWLPREVPLLSEEYFVAERARELGAPVRYEPRIHVHHSAHTTTGPKVTWRRAKGTSRAFRAIHDHARGRT